MVYGIMGVGGPSLTTMMRSPQFQIPPLFRWFWIWKISPIFFEKFWFDPLTEFRIIPVFTKTLHFPPVLENFLVPHTWVNSPDFVELKCFILHTLRLFRFLSTFTMMHLCITQCTYWTPLNGGPACIMYSCMTVCISLYMYVFMHVWVYAHTYSLVCKYVCIYVCMHVSLF